MTSVYSYRFDNQTRIGDDTCGITAREAQNNAAGSYTTTNYFLNWCGMKTPIGFATQQPSWPVFADEGRGYGNRVRGLGRCPESRPLLSSGRNWLHLAVEEGH